MTKIKKGVINLEKLRDVLQIIFYIIWIPLGLIIAFMLLTNNLSAPRMMGPGGNPQAGGFGSAGGQQQVQQQGSQQGSYGGSQQGGYNNQQQQGGSNQGSQMQGGAGTGGLQGGTQAPR